MTLAIMTDFREMRWVRRAWLCAGAMVVAATIAAAPVIADVPDNDDLKSSPIGKPDQAIKKEGKPALGRNGNVKGGESIRVEPDQAHQLTIITVKDAPFQSHKTAIGQIAFNDDLSAPVLPQFPGRVLKLFAKVGDVVSAGDPLVEIDSPEILQPQNDFIAAVTSLNKAKAQLNLAQTIDSRQRLLFDGKATPLKEVQLAEAQLAVAQNDLRSAETALDAARSKLRIIGNPRTRSPRSRTTAPSPAPRSSPRRCPARSFRARSGPASTCAPMRPIRCS